MQVGIDVGATKIESVVLEKDGQEKHRSRISCPKDYTQIITAIRDIHSNLEKEFNQELPIYADKSSITNTFSLSNYKSITEDVIGATKIYLTAINGLNDDDVRLNKRRNLSSKRLRGFERGKVGPVDGSDHVGGNYAASLNFEASFPNLLPDSTKTEIATFLDFGNVWGVDYDDSLDDTNELRSTIGAAVSWMSPIGPMNFTLSSNLKKADTDKTESFTFNLGTTF